MTTTGDHMLDQEKNKSQQILEDRNYMKHFFHPTGMKLKINNRKKNGKIIYI